MKRWGSFLLVVATIQLCAQDTSKNISAVVAAEDSASTVTQQPEESSNAVFLDDSNQLADQQQEVVIESAPALELPDEAAPEALQEDINENLDVENDEQVENFDAPQTDDISVVEQEKDDDPEEQGLEDEKPLEDEVKIDGPSLPKPVAISLPSGWQQAQKPGNYQKKAQIFKQAGDVYDKIRAVEPLILKARESFFSQKTTLNTNISKFFYEVGATQTEIAQQIDDLIQKFDEEELEDNELLEEERELVLELNQNKSDLNVLKQNIVSLTDVSVSLDNGLVQLDSLLSRVQGYEDSGWQLYQQIDEIFDDVQAADLLDQMLVIQENAEALLTYIQGAFSQFFSSSVNMITTQMAQIKSTLTSLQDRGVAIAKQEEQFDEDEAARQEAEAQAREQEAAARQLEESSTWQNKIKKYFSVTWQWIKGTAFSVYDKFFGTAAVSKSTQEASEDAKIVTDKVNAQAAKVKPVLAPQQEVAEPEKESKVVPRITLPPSTQAQPLPEPPVEIVATDATQ